ncbi:methyltransferase type 11 [Aliidongia dinghuensis]|uniref:Methyltransferase type 11 n=1 Tax=Aliidongia dinghuensis TaxID=1867774 RepID=A0A8J3E6L8_9PROT|nr:methyltransferase domain-containing protein [Aliidongia dinghuensis]GGF45822.1 methyltransferase type 11 [Aliidongia dinghuensis]
MRDGYVHGYAPREQQRLQDQARSLADLLHHDTAYPAGARVLEVGCGVGAQTVTLARRSPGAEITAVDISAVSLAEAERAVEAAGFGNVRFLEADLFDLPFAPESFDHVFACFVLEHLAQPAAALERFIRLVRPGGTVTVIEGDHGLICFHPESAAARAAIECQAALQRAVGGDALIGRRLYPLLRAAGLEAVRVSPRMVYVDGSRPDLAESFTRDTFTAMIEGVATQAVEAGLADAAHFAAGVRDLHRTAEPDGMFTYTFFKGVGTRPA